MCGFANCPGRHACLLADVSPCLEQKRLQLMEEFARPSRRRMKSGRGFVGVTDAVANSDEAPAQLFPFIAE